MCRRDICSASLLPSRDVLPHAPRTRLPPAPGRTAAFGHETSLAVSNQPGQSLLVKCGLVKAPAITNCLQGAASVEPAELGAFAEMLGTHIRLFYESVSDIRLFN